MYEGLSQVYDQLMDDFDYPAWAKYYRAILARAGCQPKTVLECGCGTGSMSIQLAKSGIKLTAGDISEDMLRLAQVKAGRCGAAIPFVLMDMRRARVPRPVDAVVCCCDGVNYLTSEGEVMSFFLHARECLKPGGAIAFDISSEGKLLSMKDAFFGEERDNVAYLWQNSFDDASRRINMSLTFFIETEGGLYRRVDEEHVQRAHSVPEIETWLIDANFRDIKTYGDRRFAPPTDADARIHFTAIRE